MKKFMLILTVVLAVFAVMACRTTITGPVDASNNPIGSKVGEATASQTFFFGFPLSYTLEVPAYEAAKNGGITKIATVDSRFEQQSGFFKKTITYTTIVTGE
ncbi:MAG: TRL-like family protein [Treponema sp.]|nr:TRL-like family protein [Treponema sp.]